MMKNWVSLSVAIAVILINVAMAQQNMPVKIKMDPVQKVPLKKLKKSPMPIATVIEDVKGNDGKTIIQKGSQVYAIYKIKKVKDLFYRSEFHVIEFKHIKDKSGSVIPVNGYIIMRSFAIEKYVIYLIPPITFIGIGLYVVRSFKVLRFKANLKNAIFNFPKTIFVTVQQTANN